MAYISKKTYRVYEDVNGSLTEDFFRVDPAVGGSAASEGPLSGMLTL